MIKYYYLTMLFLYVLGTIGGIGYTLYIHEYVVAVGVAVVAYMGFPTAVNFWKFLNE